MIKSEEYEVTGYIKKVCVCEFCNQVMEKQNYELTSSPPKYVMKCPKCGREETVDYETLTDQFILRKKEM